MEIFKKKIISFLVLHALLITTKIYCNDGTLDTTFGSNGNGTTITAASNFQGATNIFSAAAAFQGNKIILSGSSNAGGGGQTFSLARYDNNGFIDTSFGTNGTQSIVPITLFGVGTTFSELFSITVQSDNKIIAAGTSNPGGVLQFTLARFEKNGPLDSSFGTSGIVTQVIGTTSTIHSVILQPDGKIIAGGITTIAGVQQIAIARFNTDGSLDSSFGTGGIVTQIVGTSSQIIPVSLQTDGKIVVGGRSTMAGISQFTILRFNTDGSLDTSFGSGGIVIIPNSLFSASATSGSINDLVIQPNGKIIAGGNVAIGGTFNPGIVRINSNGSLDNSFSENGAALIPASSFGTGTTNAFLFSIVLQSNGKIIISGSANPGGTETFSLARLTTNGLLDPFFGINGTVTIIPLTIFGPNPVSATTSIRTLLIANGKITLGGSFTNTVDNLALARLNISIGCTINIAQAIFDKYGI